MDINTRLIKTLAQILNEQGLSTLEIDQNGTKIHLSRDFKNASFAPPLPNLVNLHQDYAPLAVPPVDNSHAYAVDNSVVATITAYSKTITSKMVGVFYASSSPDSSPYVAVGQKVNKGEVICIIEAMKTMNEIVAECDCEIVEVLATNGQLVEHGQALFSVK